MNKLVIILLSAIAQTLLEGQVMPPETALSASDGQTNDRFGGAVGISGNTIVVGAPYRVGFRGAAYVFVRNGGAWTQQAKLLPTITGSVLTFGACVGISGDTIVVAEPGSPHGSAYVFVRSGNAWTLQAQLTGSATQHFHAVAISGDTMLVGSPSEDDACPGDPECASGAAYVFVRDGGVWTQQARLTASDPQRYDIFGSAVAIEGDNLVVGAPQSYYAHQEGNGKAYVFVRSGGSWSQQARLVDSSGSTHDDFGAAVAIKGNTVVVGAHLTDTDAVGQDAGWAVVFSRNGTSWSQSAYLESDPNTASPGQEFGYSVALSSDDIVVGAPYFRTVQGGEVGSVYVFARHGTQWDRQQLGRSHTPAIAERFGYSVAIEGTLALVGAIGSDYPADAPPGKAYVYDGSGVCARFARCDPNVVWVDFAYNGTETGCSDQPYNTFVEGIAAVPADANLAFKPGSQAGSVTITKPMTLSTCGGPVTIGR